MNRMTRLERLMPYTNEGHTRNFIVMKPKYGLTPALETALAELKDYHPLAGWDMKTTIRYPEDDLRCYLAIELGDRGWPGDSKALIESLTFQPAPDGTNRLVVRPGHGDGVGTWTLVSAQYEPYDTSGYDDHASRNGHHLLLQWKTDLHDEYVFSGWKW